jgi:hypothetical protein
VKPRTHAARPSADAVQYACRFVSLSTLGRHRVRGPLILARLVGEHDHTVGLTPPGALLARAGTALAYACRG